MPAVKVSIVPATAENVSAAAVEAATVEPAAMATHVTATHVTAAHVTTTHVTATTVTAAAVTAAAVFPGLSPRRSRDCNASQCQRGRCREDEVFELAHRMISYAVTPQQR